jgi:hypothetical protein
MHAPSPISAISPNAQVHPRVITELHLAHARTNLSATARTVLGGYIYGGKIQVIKPTLATAARQSGTNIPYLRYFLRCDAAQQEALARGEVTLGSLLRPAQPEAAAHDRFLAAAAELGIDNALTLLAIAEAEHLDAA